MNLIGRDPEFQQFVRGTAGPIARLVQSDREPLGRARQLLRADSGFLRGMLQCLQLIGVDTQNIRERVQLDGMAAELFDLLAK